MTPKYKSPSKNPPFNTTTFGSRYIAPALPWIVLLAASALILISNIQSRKSPHTQNPHQNTPTSLSNPQNLIATPPYHKITDYTPSDSIPADYTNLVTLSYNITNSISDFIYTTNNTYVQSVTYIRCKPHALLITTNLTRRPCTCGFCDPSRSVAVPEHINSIGHDLTYSVSTQYLPIIYLPETNSITFSPYVF